MHRLVAAVLALAFAATAAQAATIKISAHNLWKKTGIVVQAGDVITISATGHWGWNDSYKVGPDGDPIDDFNAFDLFQPFDFFSQARLIAYIGDYPRQKRQGDGSFFPQMSGYFSVGSGQTFAAPYGGKLWLGFNDAAVTMSSDDNAGIVTAVVTVKSPGTRGPDISIVAPQGVYRVGDVVAVHYSCTDDTSVASCAGPVADGGSLNADVADHYAFTVKAVDDEGNASTKTVSYVVADASSAAVWPTAGAFGPTYLGGKSAIIPFYLTNPQPTTLNISSIAIANDFSGEFQIAGTNCGATLGPRKSCKIGVQYHPANVGTARAELRVTADMTVADVHLWGNGTQLRATPAALAFADQTEGTTSAPTIVKLQNSQTRPLVIKQIVIGGDFALDPSSTCPLAGGKLKAGRTCDIAVTFSPAASGARTGSLIVHGATQIDPVSVALSGTGVPN